VNVSGVRRLVRALALERLHLREQLRDAAPVRPVTRSPARAQVAVAIDEEFEVVGGRVRCRAEQRVGRDDLRLRIAVQPGGCSGLRYQLYFDEREIDGDIDAEFGGVHVVTDKMSAPYLMGATIDFVDTIEKQGFTIDNPNATGSCACGDSFH